MSRRTNQLKQDIEDYTTRTIVVGLEPKVTLPVITVTLKRWSDLVALDEASPSSIDGFGSKTPLARVADPMGVRFDGDGNVVQHEDDRDFVSRPAEQAALKLHTQGDPRDAVHSARLDADAAAAKAAEALAALVSALDRADNLRSTVPLNTEYCSVAKMHGLPFDEVWKVHTRTTFKDQLTPAWPEKRPVSHWVYKFVRDNKRLPTEPEMRQRLQRETVLIHA